MSSLGPLPTIKGYETSTKTSQRSFRLETLQPEEQELWTGPVVPQSGTGESVLDLDPSEMDESLFDIGHRRAKMCGV